MATVEKAVIPATAAPIRLSVAGRIDDRGFHMARVLARSLQEDHVHVSVELFPMTETAWDDFVRVTAASLGGRAVGHKLSPLVVANDDEYIGDADAFYAWAIAALRYKGKPLNPVLFNQMARTEYKKFLETHPRPHAYMDISVGDAPPTRVVFELFADKAPRTAENFLALCVGDRGTSKSGAKLHYVGSPIHRVVKGGWVQGGDIEGGHGDGGQSVFGPTFHDECLTVKHDAAGILAMASGEGPHTNGSQFYVTLGPMPWMDGKRVAFGRVARGMRVFRVIEKLDAINQRPRVPVLITGAGLYSGTLASTE